MKSQKGVTLIELMVVVAVIAILAKVMLPMYATYVIRGKIPDATSNLASKRTQMEQFYQDNRTYVGGGGCTADTTTSKYFTFNCTGTGGAPTATTYIIQAVGTGTMAGFTYTIDQGNNKQTTAAPAAWALATMPGTPAIAGSPRRGGNVKSAAQPARRHPDRTFGRGGDYWHIVRTRCPKL